MTEKQTSMKHRGIDASGTLVLSVTSKQGDVEVAQWVERKEDQKEIRGAFSEQVQGRLGPCQAQKGKEG